jgi:hypothetical protein
MTPRDFLTYTVRPQDVRSTIAYLHRTDTPALEAGGLTQLFGQVFSLTDFLTPAVIKTATGLLREWVDDELSAKS